MRSEEEIKKRLQWFEKRLEEAHHDIETIGETVYNIELIEYARDEILWVLNG